MTILFPPEPFADDLPRWKRIARRFTSPCVSIDVARLTDGAWTVVEIGDGGVSGLPAGLDLAEFYASLRDRLTPEAGIPAIDRERRDG